MTRSESLVVKWLSQSVLQEHVAASVAMFTVLGVRCIRWSMTLRWYARALATAMVCSSFIGSRYLTSMCVLASAKWLRSMPSIRMCS